MRGGGTFYLLFYVFGKFNNVSELFPRKHFGVNPHAIILISGTRCLAELIYASVLMFRHFSPMHFPPWSWKPVKQKTKVAFTNSHLKLVLISLL